MWKQPENIAIMSSLTHGFFNSTISKTVTDLHEVDCEKCQRKGFQHLDDPPDFF